MQAAHDPDATPRAWGPREYPRLQMSAPARLALATTGGLAIGATLGAAHGGKAATLRFRAEHAHRMPTRTTDWYFYHRSKNYHAIFGALREGAKMGARLGFWAFGLVWLEHTVDRYRGSADLISTVVASLSVSGAFSLWSKSRWFGKVLPPRGRVCDVSVCAMWFPCVRLIASWTNCRVSRGERIPVCQGMVS